MFRSLALAVGMTAFAQSVFSQDGIAPETVEAIKKAAVFIRVEGDGWSGSGSGFVIHDDTRGVLIATNQHVISSTPPLGVVASAKPVKLTVVFGSGTKEERSYAGAVVAADVERDLAVVRVDGVKDAPKPVAYNDSPKLVETMAVYSFGYPFGKALATSKLGPAVTIGKASISSLRVGDDGELSFVQIDGNLNPGNSGGPVVDVKGRLVGVAVATIRDGQGIGLTVPAPQLVQMMQGRIGRVKVTPKKKGEAITVRIEADIIDPLNNLRAPVAHYIIVDRKAKRPEAALDRLPGSKLLNLKVQKGVAGAEFTVPKAEGEVLVQVVANFAGRTSTTAIRGFTLTPGLTAADFAGPPTAGWKEYTPRDRSFVIWVPERAARQAEQTRTLAVGAQRLRINTILGRTQGGLIYEAQSLRLPAGLKGSRTGLYDVLRNAIAAEMKGKVIETNQVEMGQLTAREYLIRADSKFTRVRMYISLRVYMVQVTGTAAQVHSREAETILGSYRRYTAGTAPMEPDGIAKGAKEPKEAVRPKETTAGKAPRDTSRPNEVTPVGKDPTILAGAVDPRFKDLAPESGLLVGLEIGTVKRGNTEWIKSARPIYRVGDKESFGNQYGTNLSNVTTLKAKSGYAVGAITAKHGLFFDGMSITFMRIVDGKLDPKDSYESEWVGTNERKPPTKLGGDGTRVIGIVGKSSKRAKPDMTGFGLLFNGQEGFDPTKK
jgi:S1-C subfamily serine protease